MVVGGYVVSAVCIAFLIWFCTTPYVRQPVLNLLASAGYGETVEGATFRRIDCTGGGRSGRAFRQHECELVMTVPSGRRRALRMYSTSDLEAAWVGRAARFGGEFGVELPGWALFGQWLMPLGLGGLAVFFAWLGLSFHRQRRAVARLAPWARTARIVDVDLLRRRISGRHSWDWDYAFDSGGRRYASGRLQASQPALADSIETRGAALLGSDGRTLLLNERLAPLDIGPEEIGRLAQATHASAAAWAPHLMPALDALIANAPEGPERDFLEAWLAAWTDDADAHRRALDRRHAAARRLTRERVDELLQRARAAATP